MSPEEEEMLIALAAREATGCLLHPSLLPDTPGLIVPPVPPVGVCAEMCPACGMTPTEFGRHAEPLPFSNWTIVAPTDPVPDRPVLRVLACERLVPRSVLAMTTAIEQFGPSDSSQFITRAVHWARAGAPAPGTDGFRSAAAASVLAEQWVDALPQARADLGPAMARFRAAMRRIAGAGLTPVVPAAGRAHDERAFVVAPHGRGDGEPEYRRLLLARVTPNLVGQAQQGQ
ncbi:hypothetical protein AB0368_07010 [Actinoplanes sp. NPDC051475]|uniref:hypothetical protein n=1 Tax=Actinoplanes sp. NPDC051475 TaxID=3157225 RepID=UPI0034505858